VEVYSLEVVPNGVLNLISSSAAMLELYQYISIRSDCLHVCLQGF